jgi:AcrR family transcriptional regulator
VSSTAPYGDPETRQRILAKAWELLEGRGSEVTLAEIAKGAGVSRQALYLHFGDRSGLFVALVDHVDLSLGSTEIRAHVIGAPSGAETLRRWVEALSWYTGKIDRLTQILEWGQYEDEALAAGWRNRMNRRRDLMLGVAERIADEGRLAEGWTTAEAADLIYAITMPGPWRELTREVGWSEEEYAERVWRLLESSLLTTSDE